MIKPCPFCGTVQPLDPCFTREGAFLLVVFIRCIACEARGPAASSEEMAELAWDERFPLQPEPDFKPEPEQGGSLGDGSGSMRS